MKLTTKAIEEVMEGHVLAGPPYGAREQARAVIYTVLGFTHPELFAQPPDAGAKKLAALVAEHVEPLAPHASGASHRTITAIVNVLEPFGAFDAHTPDGNDPAWAVAWFAWYRLVAKHTEPVRTDGPVAFRTDLVELITWIAKNTEADSIFAAPVRTYSVNAHDLLDEICRIYGLDKTLVSNLVDEVVD